mgnify:CR=1 FL=1
MLAPAHRPVGRHHVEVGPGGEGPELIGETQVVTHEERDADPFDLDLAEGPSGAEMLVFAAERERRDLVVAVHGAVGPGDHETVGGAAGGGACVSSGGRQSRSMVSPAHSTAVSIALRTSRALPGQA